MRVILLWRSAVIFLALLLAGLLAVDFEAGRALRQQTFEAGFARLEDLARVALARPPQLGDPSAVEAWAAAMAAGGVRVTVIANDGTALADSEGDAETSENHSDEPEFRAALDAGEGRDLRPGPASAAELLYLAVRYSGAGPAFPAVLRFALPVSSVNRASSARRGLWVASFLFFFLATGLALLLSRRTSGRIRQLEEFSRRVARGDFRPLAMASGAGELDDLARALNETAVRLDETIRVLTDERNRSAAILGSMIEGVAVINAQERVLFSNRAFSQILGLETVPVPGRSLLEVVRQTDLLEIIRKALRGPEQVSSEIVVGTLRPRNFAVAAAPVRADGAGGVAGAVLVLHDISELRRLERVRQDFVANVSHEFRTPLTAIQGFAETLLGGALEDPANRRRFVSIIRDHAARLARLTEDLLQLSRIEAGRLEIDFRPTSIPRLIETCLETAQIKAASKQIALAARFPDGLPPVRGDANHLQEVLLNLLDNAILYTPAGGHVEVSAEQMGDQVVVTVSDTGIGIPEAEQGRIFERFYRVDAARSRGGGGTGLGLSITRHILEAHGGRIWVESTVGEGSRFHFAVPVAA